MSRNHYNDTIHFADINVVEEFAAGLSPDVIKCRSRGHDMDDHDVTVDESGNYLVIEKCRRRNCETERHSVVDSEGIILSSRTVYKEGYLMPKGTGRLNKEAKGVFRAFRLERSWKARVSRRRR